MKKYRLSIIVGCFILGQLGWSQELLNGIKAIVGDEMILFSDWLQTSQEWAMRFGINPTTQMKEFEKIKQDVLQELIFEKILLAKAKEDTITVDEQQVESELDNWIQGLISQFGSKEKVESQVGMPIKKLKKDYRDAVRKKLIIQKVQGEKLKGIQISRHEVEEFYESVKDSLPEKAPEVRLRHLLLEIRPSEATRQNALERIRKIQEQFRSGDDFETLARKYSEDPGTASRGGNLGFVERGTLFQVFEETAFQLESGKVSDIVETPVGFHLIQTLEKRGDKVNLRHILIRLGTADSDEKAAKEKIIDIRNQALNGEDFIKLVKEFSEDESTREQDGNLGWLPLDKLQIPIFKEVADTLKVGEISQPFKTPFGYHLVKMEGKKPARAISLEEDWADIRSNALNRKNQKILHDWIQELKKDVYIDIKEDMK